MFVIECFSEIHTLLNLNVSSSTGAGPRCYRSTESAKGDKGRTTVHNINVVQQYIPPPLSRIIPQGISGEGLRVGKGLRVWLRKSGKGLWVWVIGKGLWVWVGEQCMVNT